ncbi:MAG TPA: helix-turn-helix domain-containing protein [Actinomycetota bacterium]|nr:helix-turn-helix domain-containing protein [Actinomycetota bacterium]
MGPTTLTRLAPEAASKVRRSLPRALRGDHEACRDYAEAWRMLVADLLEPYSAPPSAAAILERLAIVAPFHPDGPFRAVVSVANGIIPDMSAITAARVAPADLPPPADLERFTRLVLAHLAGAGSGLPHLMAAWDLSVTEVARLFGVRRQAVQQWLDQGVPPARRSKLVAILGVADLLERNLRPERIPGIVRAPVAADGDRSMLDAIADDGHGEVLKRTRRSFDWAWSA